MVAGGNMQDTTTIDSKYSPTVGLDKLLIVLAVAAHERRYISSMDIQGAYLECRMEGNPVYMWLNKTLTQSVTAKKPEFSKFVTENGKILVKLERALYGCVQSAKLWYNKLSEKLIESGYTMNPIDNCIFNKIVRGKQVTVIIYVDDLLLTHIEQKVLIQEIESIGSGFSGYSSQTTNHISYLGMEIINCEDGININMNNYVHKTLEEFGEPKMFNSPSSPNPHMIDGHQPLQLQSREKFHSTVARLLYLAKRVRPDILFTVSILSSKVKEPLQRDMGSLMRLIGYLMKTKNSYVKFRNDTKLSPTVYCDASFMSEDDAKSRSGIVICMCGAVVDAHTSKQKLVAKSSAESELIALCEGVSEALAIKEFLSVQGHTVTQVTVYEDNKSTMDLVVAGKPTSRNTKHINLRYFFVKQHVDNKDINLEYCKTSDMLADIFTKPLIGNQFSKFRDMMIKVK